MFADANLNLPDRALVESSAGDSKKEFRSRNSSSDNVIELLKENIADLWARRTS